jgi:hypothetical protein
MPVCNLDEENSMIRWREKFVAFGIHFLVTLSVGACAAALIFLVWFPAPFQEMVGGTKLFLLVISCDLALGPLLSLVIYNSEKSRRELIVDYCIVGVVQLAALIYGVYVVSGARPVYVAFVTDRIEVVTASEIAKSDVEQAKQPQYRSLPKFGPRLVGTYVPPSEHDDALFAGLEGRDISVRPRFYVPFAAAVKDVRQRAQSLDVLEQKKPHDREQIESALRKVGSDRSNLGWLPVKHRTGFWTAIIDRSTGLPLTYINLDPY